MSRISMHVFLSLSLCLPLPFPSHLSVLIQLKADVSVQNFINLREIFEVIVFDATISQSKSREKWVSLSHITLLFSCHLTNNDICPHFKLFLGFISSQQYAHNVLFISSTHCWLGRV